MTNTQEGGAGNSTSALAKLLNQINLPTLAMILLMGGGNIFATKDDGRLTREEAQRVVSQVRDMHNALDDFENRQKQMIEKEDDALRRLTQLQNKP